MFDIGFEPKLFVIYSTIPTGMDDKDGRKPFEIMLERNKETRVVV